MIRSTRMLCSMLTVVILILVLGGCAAPAPAPTPAPAALATATVVPTKSAPAGPIEVRFGTSVDFPNLDPREASESNTRSLQMHIYEKLVDVDPKTGSPIPELATAWKTSPDGRVWTFTLRKGVVFHDGAAFNAEAVKLNFDMFMDPKVTFGRRSTIAPLGKADVVDEYTVSFTTPEPLGGLLYILTNPSSAIISPKALKEKTQKDFAKTMVGTGPFKFVEWKPGVSLVLERFGGYWGGKRTNIEKITFVPVPEEATRAAMLETGELDLAFTMPADLAAQLAKVPTLTQFGKPTTRFYEVFLNQQRKPFTDARVRKAIAYAIDKRAMLNSLFKGRGVVANSWVNAGVAGKIEMPVLEYDPQKAKALLADAGFPNGFDTVMWTPVGRYPKDKEASEAIVGYLREVGIRATLVPMDYNTYWVDKMAQPLVKSELQIAYGSYGNEMMDINWELYLGFESKSFPSYNRVFYSNPKYDDIVHEARYTIDETKRNALYADAQRMLWEDMPSPLLFSLEQIIVHNKRVQGIVLMPNEWVHLRDAQVVSQ